MRKQGAGVCADVSHAGGFAAASAAAVVAGGAAANVAGAPEMLLSSPWRAGRRLYVR